ncbi:MAG TPA: hypothetical protein DCQ26_04295 [Marinilabiliales bacterium]|nr:MAG: hypothetical protein A2W95_03145 [Bacteroidetes bacterium GWA2_40_14]OFX61096.1 MAG: hypothetical protein A2W84_09630 [Bacteroidetes bacterium GWC2_40_13]OFX72700.1 MAG: hypothetical protein A2W96_18330 [Bacteroidetes bacterium GWD2_40_43]OFX91330.1 MAG: hypothetical protein A2W97_03750 [Bacteroidetes bacterium GWE2_40_63]OFY19400.1 MAG: hypothetical protein A2W88_01630 [Bacteroidetes bacterium GWF2_40_13]OFZ26052.1 MAG: hypothetical protein A2437_10755 [Bacteroidetes bacterium RIFOXYC
MEAIFDILFKKISGQNLTLAEETKLSDWLLDAENLELYNDYQKIWKTTGKLSFELKPDVNSEWFLFKERLAVPAKRPIHRLYYTTSAVAASLILAFGIWSITQTFFQSNKVYQTTNTIQQLQLPDNSNVVLNRNTILTLDKNFNSENRIVNLNGEAFFEITKDTEHPFVVSTLSGTEVKVLGTSFNFKVTATENHLDVFTGTVSFRTPKSEEPVLVKKGEHIVYSAANNHLSAVSKMNVNADSWKTMNFTFDNTPITEVADQLSSFIGKEVVLPKNTDNVRYSGTFSNPTDQQVAEVLALAMGWEYKISKNSVTFIIKEKALR